MRIVRSTLGAAALGMLAGIAGAETSITGSERASGTVERTTGTVERTTGAHESASVTWSGGSWDTALSERQCVTEVMSRVNRADVKVLTSRPVKEGSGVRVAVSARIARAGAVWRRTAAPPAISGRTRIRAAIITGTERARSVPRDMVESRR